MALLRDKISEIPKDAIILSEQDALRYEIKVLKSWKNQRDVWPINYGGVILASASALSGMYINNHFRLKFKLFSYGRLSSYLPLCVIPAVMSYVLHSEFVLPGVILQKACAVCLEMRASALQAGMGCAFPMILAPIAVSSLAIRYNTYDVPPLSKKPMKVLQLWKKQTKPISNILFAIFVGHALLASTITYLEAKSVERVNDKLMLLGYELERQDELL